MRVNEVAFQLLQYQKQHDERQCLHGADHENQECSYHAADECPENGDQCCEGDEDAYQQGIREAQKCHGNKEHGTKNDGFQTLSGEELGKCAVCQGSDFQHTFCLLFFQISKQQLPALSAQFFFLNEDVAGKDKANDKRGHAAENALYHRECGAQYDVSAALENICGFFDDFIPVQIQICQPLGNFFVVVEQFFQFIQQDGYVCLDGSAQSGNGSAQFWDCLLYTSDAADEL